MSIRHYLTLIEGRTELVDVNDRDVRVLVDPPALAVERFAELRGIIADDGHLYVWDAYAATHDEIANGLMVSIIAGVYRGDGRPMRLSQGFVEDLHANKAFVRAFGAIDVGY